MINHRNIKIEHTQTNCETDMAFHKIAEYRMSIRQLQIDYKIKLAVCGLWLIHLADF